jgi:hypothetical protein
MTDFEYKPSSKIVRAARTFIKSVCEVYGSDRGLEFWDNIRKNLGEDIAGDIFFGMITQAGTDEVLVKSTGINKIAIIKEIRQLTGWGLKESKDFVDSVEYNGEQLLKLTDVDASRIETFVQAMAALGAVVE